jgi:exopolysaccharide biosynthesis WecB/TagA/CpsF family protein
MGPSGVTGDEVAGAGSSWGGTLPPKLPVFGVGVSRTDSYDEVAGCVVAAAREGRPLVVSALSVHALMTAATEPAMRRAIARADVVTTDGQPVRWALNALHGTHLTRRVCGPTLTLEVCGAAAHVGLPIFLYGSRAETLAALAGNLRSQFSGLVIAGVDPSRMRPRTFPPPVDDPEDLADVERIRASGARVLLVGLGCPLQELWAARHRDALSMPVLCVGAAFDFHAGVRARAPRLLQDAGLEWLFRLAQDPRRLARRYAITNTQFLLALARELLWAG